MTRLLLCLCLAAFLAQPWTSQAAATEATIRAATQFCEGAVRDYCISTTCPQFCASLVGRASRKEACRQECVAEKRCQLKPVVGQDSNTNLALDAQSRDQLWACIAERRDPNNTKTGRRTTPWQQLRTQSFQRATRP